MTPLDEAVKPLQQQFFEAGETCRTELPSLLVKITASG